MFVLISPKDQQYAQLTILWIQIPTADERCCNDWYTIMALMYTPLPAVPNATADPSACQRPVYQLDNFPCNCSRVRREFFYVYL